MRTLNVNSLYWCLMHITTYLDDLVVWAPAKVNLFLEVLGKRPDGYHEIATLMVAVRLYDTVIFRESAALTLQCSDTTLSAGPDNLVLRAAKLLQDRTGCRKGASIRLIKRIPMAAGLAGGSTDAAATLLGLNRLWQLGLSARDLAKLSSEIGSDIPFFFQLPAAWCTGRGEIVNHVNLPIKLHFMLLCPAFGLATATVYKNVAVPPTAVSGDALRLALSKGDVDSIGRLMHNRLQLAAEKIEPRVGEFARMLAECSPAGSLMSGSGSTMFALCRSAADAERIAASLKTRTKAHDFRMIVTRTI
ncbi:MAG: 4-(cytidine 5'-diphospho)-2-C-methyl-D-erythritol kinase [Gemmataceae bacterium]|nr:4-(cytidine 5'-diphospho)-2-C-methyl-D-erythritol kinase [Gemmataceae bacterium]